MAMSDDDLTRVKLNSANLKNVVNVATCIFVEFVHGVFKGPFVQLVSGRPGYHLETSHAAQIIHDKKRIAFKVLSQKRLHRLPVRKQARVFIRPAQQDEILAERTAQIQSVRVCHKVIIAGLECV